MSRRSRTTRDTPKNALEEIRGQVFVHRPLDLAVLSDLHDCGAGMGFPQVVHSTWRTCIQRGAGQSSTSRPRVVHTPGLAAKSRGPTVELDTDRPLVSGLSFLPSCHCGLLTSPSVAVRHGKRCAACRWPRIERTHVHTTGAGDVRGARGRPRVSVVDERWPRARPDPHRRPPFDRQPPQDLAAEQSVLGGMLLSKDAIADVMESLSLQRLLQAGALAGLRRDHGSVLAGRAGRHHHGRRGAGQERHRWAGSAARSTCTP